MNQLPDSKRSEASEVDQLDVAQRPAQVASELARFLDLGPEKLDAIKDVLVTKTPENTGGAHADVGAIDDVGWDGKQIETYQAICGGIARQYGYSKNSSYWLRGRES